MHNNSPEMAVSYGAKLSRCWRMIKLGRRTSLKECGLHEPERDITCSTRGTTSPHLITALESLSQIPHWDLSRRNQRPFSNQALNGLLRGTPHSRSYVINPHCSSMLTA